MEPLVVFARTPCRCIRPSVQLPRRASVRRFQHSSSIHHGNEDSERQSSAAAHILAQARIEEANLSASAIGLSSQLRESQRKEIPWQGEESIEDAVLRMLVDKYKPLRIPGTQRKIQQPPADPLYIPPSSSLLAGNTTARRIYDSQGNLDQSAPGYTWQEGDPPRFPWEHTFTSPANKDGSPLVRSGVLTRSVSPSKSPGTSTSTSHNKSARPNAGDIAARVFRARDASVDYASGSHDIAKAKAALGTKGGRNDPKTRAQAAGVGNFQPMPTNIRAWNSMVEERIELARQQGLFNNIKGRGKPIERDPEESNPFLGRSEFLMNRIVKRQEAAPPFVELQREMRADLDSFRARLRTSWIRRATRILSLQPLTPSIVNESVTYRDQDWEIREQAYHERAITGINSLIRKYNVVAPSSVRMNVTDVKTELQACYRDCGDMIKEELERRTKAGLTVTKSQIQTVKMAQEKDIKGRVALVEEKAVRETMLSAMRKLARDIFARQQP